MSSINNSTYKDTYHFKRKAFVGRWSDKSSLETDPEINTTLKENPYASNVEVEKDEVVLKPDFSALFNVRGKTHKQGGTNVLLEDNSFVFSNDKSLSFNKKDHDLMELKKGGNFRPSKNTPADVLKRNIPLKDYNKMIAIIDDERKDDISKNSATKMLEKYLEKIGNIAYLQESKKDFPTGVPFFSRNTAPVYDDEVKGQIMEQEQYKYGGLYKKNPKAQMGTWMRFRGCLRNSESCSGNWEGRAGAASQNNTAPAVSDVPKISGVPEEDKVLPPGVRHVDKIPMPEPKAKPRSTITPPPPRPMVLDIQNNQTGYKSADWQFTPWQKENQAYNLWKWASAKRYMPYRSHLNPSYVDPQLVNPEQTINDLKSGYNANLRGINSLNPILRNAQASEAYGQLLNTMPGVRSQYDNQNAGIVNQTRSYNNQIANNTRSVNMQNDQNYYKESVVGQQNFDNLKSYLSDKFMSDRATDVADNQSLAYQLLTQNNPAYKYDWKTGRFLRTNKSIMDVQTSPQSDLVTGLLNKLLGKFDTLDPRLQSSILKIATLKNLPLNYQKKGEFINPYN